MPAYINCVEVTPECTVADSIYGYAPSLGANSFFLAFFALFCVLNIILGVVYKTWTYSILMTLACLTETLGYAGRIILHDNVYNNNGFIMQICCLIMGPAWNSGAIYLTLKYVTLTFGPEWSRIKPYLYTWIFITCDVLALTLQAIGGAMASTSDGNSQQLTNGDNIALTGISWQVFTLVLFAVSATDFLVRRFRSSTSFSPKAAATLSQTKFQVFAVAISLAWLCVFIRCVYRIAEFAKGWGNPIMTDQTTFIVLEGVMIVIATFCQTVFHPGYCFPALSSSSRRKTENIEEEPKIMDNSDSSRVVLNVTEGK